MRKPVLYLLFSIGFLASCSHNEDSPGRENGEMAALDSTAVQDTSLQGGISLQVAAFQTRDNAEKTLARFADSPLPVYIAEDARGQIYRVRVGPFAEHSEAEEALSEVQRMGFPNAYLVTEDFQYIMVAIDSTVAEVEIPKKQITFRGRCRFPRWSPNGREIGFYKTENGVSGLFTVGTGGGPPSKIVIDSKNRKILPKFAWSPRGDKLAFVAQELNSSWDYVENLYVIQKNGTNLKRLLRQDHFAFEIYDLKWSPDGQYLAFNASHGREGVYSDLIQKVMIVAVHSGETWDASFWQKTNWLVGWQENSSLLFLSSYEGMHPPMTFAYEIWRYHLQTKEPELLVPGPAVLNCQTLELWHNKNMVVFSAFDYQSNAIAAIAAVDMTTGSTDTLASGTAKQRLSEHFLISAKDYVYYTSMGKLWRSDQGGNRSDLGISLDTDDFTISPYGGKLCVQQDGHLFTISLPPAQL